MNGASLTNIWHTVRDSAFSTLWAALGVGAVLCIVGALWLRRRRAARSVAAIMGRLGLDRVHDVMIPDGLGGQIQLDYLVLTPRGLVVVDVRDYRGTIFAGETIDRWTQIVGRRSFHFENPLFLNRARMMGVKSLAGDVPVYELVAFTRDGQFPKGMPPQVCYVDQLGASAPFATAAGLPGEPPLPVRLAWQTIRQAAVRSLPG
ncbi:MAG: nuclease-related domain-containing protein [Gammaproteobacteria bacterium]